MIFRQTHVRLLIAPITLAVFDCGITLWFQAPGYWGGGNRVVNEAQFEANWLMYVHPIAGLVFHALWIGAFSFVILSVPLRAAIIAATAVTLGHTVGAASWVLLHFPHPYHSANVLAVTAALLLAGSLPIPTADRSEKAPASWPRRLIIGAIIAAAVFVCLIPHGTPPRAVMSNVPRQPAGPIVRPYGAHAGEIVAAQWSADSPGIGDTSARVGLWGNGPAFILWANAPGDWIWTGQQVSQRGPLYSKAHYELGAPLSPKQSAKLQAEIFENELGRMAQFEINGTLYDLNKGGLFLASAGGAGPEVLQLEIDVSKLSPDKQGLEMFAHNHPEIAEFFARRRADHR